MRGLQLISPANSAPNFNPSTLKVLAGNKTWREFLSEGNAFLFQAREKAKNNQANACYACFRAGQKFKIAIDLANKSALSSKPDISREEYLSILQGMEAARHLEIAIMQNAFSSFKRD